MNDYVVVNGKKFRKGYTTGSCAAAASKAAVAMLFSGEAIDSIRIDTPAGIRLTLEVVDITRTGNAVKCAVEKDGGDDPDITTGLKIYAEASAVDGAGIRVKAAEGIGMVTLPGLKVPVGMPAINPVPMKMILKEAAEVLPEGKGVEIILSVPGGEETAKRTYNPRLGIMGGISILGTSGIVEPMSEEAWKDSLALELGMMAAKGYKQAVFTFGNYGESFTLSKLDITGDKVITTSNFVGFMLDQAVEKGFEEVVIVGHLGKLVKVAAGIFHTHSRVADARMEILTAYAGLEGCPKEVLETIYACRTTEAASAIIDACGLHRIYERLVSDVARRCTQYSFDKLKVGAVLFNAEDHLLAADKNAEEILDKLRGTYGG